MFMEVGSIYYSHIIPMKSYNQNHLPVKQTSFLLLLLLTLTGINYIVFIDKSYSKHWIHNGFVTIENTKMSKSLSNFKTLR